MWKIWQTSSWFPIIYTCLKCLEWTYYGSVKTLKITVHLAKSNAPCLSGVLLICICHKSLKYLKNYLVKILNLAKVIYGWNSVKTKIHGTGSGVCHRCIYISYIGWFISFTGSLGNNIQNSLWDNLKFILSACDEIHPVYNFISFFNILVRYAMKMFSSMISNFILFSMFWLMSMKMFSIESVLICPHLMQIRYRDVSNQRFVWSLPHNGEWFWFTYDYLVLLKVILHKFAISALFLTARSGGLL